MEGVYHAADVVYGTRPVLSFVMTAMAHKHNQLLFLVALLSLVSLDVYAGSQPESNGIDNASQLVSVFVSHALYSFSSNFG